MYFTKEGPTPPRPIQKPPGNGQRKITIIDVGEHTLKQLEMIIYDIQSKKVNKQEISEKDILNYKEPTNFNLDIK